MATQTPPPAIDTSALTPQFQALYDQQLPALQKAQTQAAQARGMFYSGDALNSQTLAQEQLLASLLAQQQAQTQQTSINQANINQAQSAQENQTKAANRNTNLSLIGSGVGAAAGLLGLKYLRPGSGLTNTMMVDGQPVTVNGDGTYTPMQPTGVGGSSVPGGSASSNSFDGEGGPPVPAAAPSVGSGLGSLTGTVAPPSGLAALSSPSDQMMSTLPGMAANPGVGLVDGGIPSWGSGGLDSLSSGVSALPDLSSGISGAMPDLSAGIGDAASSGLGALSSFAKGGIISKPTIAQIGDAGPGNPEEVIPLNKLQGAIGPQGAARVMAAVPQPGTPGFGQPTAPQPGMTPTPMPSMWSQPSAGGPVPPQPAPQPLNALQRGGLLGNLFKPS